MSGHGANPIFLSKKIKIGRPEHLLTPTSLHPIKSQGAGNMVFVREGFIVKQMKNFETKNAETICLELIIVKKKWCILFAYRPSNTDKEKVFHEVSVSLNKI